MDILILSLLVLFVVHVKCLHQLKHGKHHKHKVQRSVPALVQDDVTTCKYNHHHCRLNRSSTALCNNQCNLHEGLPFPLYTNLALMQVALIAALCCAGLIWSAVVVVVVACCSCMLYWLALMLAQTFAPCACGISLLSTGVNIPLAHVVASPSTTCTGGAYSSTYWCKILYLHSGNMRCVVVLMQKSYVSATCTTTLL